MELGMLAYVKRTTVCPLYAYVDADGRHHEKCLELLAVGTA
jgi:hypothetical protein